MRPRRPLPPRVMHRCGQFPGESPLPVTSVGGGVVLGDHLVDLVEAEERELAEQLGDLVIRRLHPGLVEAVGRHVAGSEPDRVATGGLAVLRSVGLQ